MEPKGINKIKTNVWIHSELYFKKVKVLLETRTQALELIPTTCVIVVSAKHLMDECEAPLFISWQKEIS